MSVRCLIILIIEEDSYENITSSLNVHHFNFIGFPNNDPALEINDWFWINIDGFLASLRGIDILNLNPEFDYTLRYGTWFFI